MSTIEMALALDYARRGALVIPAVLLAMIVVPLWILGGLGAQGALAADTKEGVAVHVTLTLVMGFIACVAVMQAQGAIGRFFVRPISAARLVACQMLLGAVTVGLLYAAAISLVNLGGADWPVLGPSLFLATTLVCGLAAIWSLEGSIVAQVIGLTSTSTPLLIWFSRCYGSRFMGDWNVMWHNPTAAEALTLFTLALVAYVCAVKGVARVRRGDVWNFAAFQEWLERLNAHGPAPTAFGSPRAAQAWSEWREKMGPVPACILIFAVLLSLSAWLTGFATADDALDFVIGMPLVLLMVIGPLLFGLIAGNCGKAGGPGMKHVIATRPVTDSFLAAAILRNCASALVWSFVAWVISVVVVGGLVYWSGQREHIDEQLARMTVEGWKPLVLVVVVPLTAWTVTAIMASLSATGRPWLFVTVFCALFGIGLILILIKNAVSPVAWEQIFAVWLIGSAGFCMVGTIWCFLLAARYRLISMSTIAWSAGGWLLLAVGAVYTINTQPPNLAVMLHCLGLLSLPFLPLPAMPLAIRLNRHR